MAAPDHLEQEKREKQHSWFNFHTKILSEERLPENLTTCCAFVAQVVSHKVISIHYINMPSISKLSSVALMAAAVVLLLALYASHLLQQRVATRRYLPERQDLSMEEGQYTLEEFQDMMV